MANANIRMAGPYEFGRRFEDGAAATTATGDGQVSSATSTQDVGPGRLVASTFMSIYISANDSSSSNETYELAVRGSTSSGFSSPVTLASVPITAGVTGSLEMPFTNVQFGTAYRYLRMTATLGGTTPSITYTAHMTHVPGA